MHGRCPLALLFTLLYPVVSLNDWCNSTPNVGNFTLQRNCQLSAGKCMVPNHTTLRTIEYYRASSQSSVCVTRGLLRIVGRNDKYRPVISRTNRSEKHRFFTVFSTGRLILAHLNLTGGHGVIGGGAIWINGISGTMLVLSNVAFYDNVADFFGGAIFAPFVNNDERNVQNASIVAQRNCIFEKSVANLRKNRGSVGGGAVYIGQGSFLLLRSVIKHNSVVHQGSGGGIFCGTSLEQIGGPPVTCKIVLSNISNNAAHDGGGIHCQGRNTFCNISQAHIILNNASTFNRGAGGGVNVDFGVLVVRGSLIQSNFASDGGGINCREKCVCKFAWAVIRFNGAHKGGGIKCQTFAKCVLQNYSVVAANMNIFDPMYDFGDRAPPIDPGVSCTNFFHQNFGNVVFGCITDETVFSALPPYPATCPPGKFRSFMMTMYDYTEQRHLAECTPCRAGRYSNTSDQNSCDACSPGKYELRQGRQGCSHICPLGKIGAVEGAPSENATCRLCQAGRYQGVSTDSKLHKTGICKHPCPAGRFGLRAGQATLNLACLKCPKGRYGDNHLVGLDELSAACPNVCPPGTYGLVEGATSRENACTECFPVENCEGGTSCSPSTDGLLCTQCRQHPQRHYVGPGLICVRCSDDAVQQYIFIFVFVCVASAFLFWTMRRVQKKFSYRRYDGRKQARANKKVGMLLQSREMSQRGLASVGALASNSQTIMQTMPSMNVNIVPFDGLKVVFGAISTDVLSSFRSPECDVADNLLDKYRVKLLYPAALVLLFAIWGGWVKVLYKGVKRDCLTDSVIAVAGHLLYINCFSMITTLVLRPLACTKGEGKHNYFLSADATIECSVMDQQYVAIFIWSMAGIVFYICIPLVFLVRYIYGLCRCDGKKWSPYATEADINESGQDVLSVIRKRGRSQEVIENKITSRAFRRGAERKTSAANMLVVQINEEGKKTRFFNRYGWLFIKYKANRPYWELVILARKILLVTITIFLNKNDMVALPLQGVVILLALFLHCYASPYVNALENEGAHDKKKKKCHTRAINDANNHLETAFLIGHLLLVIGAFVVKSAQLGLKSDFVCLQPNPKCPLCKTNIKPFGCYDANYYPLSKGQDAAFCGRHQIPGTNTNAQAFYVGMDLVLKLTSGDKGVTSKCITQALKLYCIIGAPPCERDCTMKRFPMKWRNDLNNECRDVHSSIRTRLEEAKDQSALFEMVAQGYADRIEDASDIEGLTLKNVSEVMGYFEAQFKGNAADSLFSSNMDISDNYLHQNTCLEREACNTSTLVFRPRDDTVAQLPINQTRTLEMAAANYYPRWHLVGAAFQLIGFACVVLGAVLMVVNIIYLRCLQRRAKKQLEAAEKERRPTGMIVDARASASCPTINEASSDEEEEVVENRHRRIEVELTPMVNPMHQ